MWIIGVPKIIQHTNSKIINIQIKGNLQEILKRYKRFQGKLILKDHTKTYPMVK